MDLNTCFKTSCLTTWKSWRSSTYVLSWSPCNTEQTYVADMYFNLCNSEYTGYKPASEIIQDHIPGSHIYAKIHRWIMLHVSLDMVYVNLIYILIVIQEMQKSLKDLQAKQSADWHSEISWCFFWCVAVVDLDFTNSKAQRCSSCVWWKRTRLKVLGWNTVKFVLCQTAVIRTGFKGKFNKWSLIWTVVSKLCSNRFIFLSSMVLLVHFLLSKATPQATGKLPEQEEPSTIPATDSQLDRSFSATSVASPMPSETPSLKSEKKQDAEKPQEQVGYDFVFWRKHFTRIMCALLEVNQHIYKLYE